MTVARSSERRRRPSYDFLFGHVIHGSRWDTLGSTRRSHRAHKYDWGIGVALTEPDPSSHSHRITVRCLVCSLYDDLIGFQSKTTVNPFDYHRSPPEILDPFYTSFIVASRGFRHRVNSSYDLLLKNTGFAMLVCINVRSIFYFLFCQLNLQMYMCQIDWALKVKA